jgi:DNA replicative helicase MCM subunit Mcm2 (Cdc46/Mcm family)
VTRECTFAGGALMLADVKVFLIK